MKRYVSTFIVPVLFAAAALTAGCVKDTAECAAADGDRLTLSIALPASEAVATYATESGSAVEDKLVNLYVKITPASGPAQDFTISMSGVTGTTDGSGHRIYSKDITVPSNIFSANDRIEVRKRFTASLSLQKRLPARK